MLITGANGYIGQRLIPELLREGHRLVCCVRNRRRFEEEHSHPDIDIIEIDFLEPDLAALPEDIDVAYYLLHAMSSRGDFAAKEAAMARNFVRLLGHTRCRQIIYLGGMANEARLSRHLASRLATEKILATGNLPVTTLRAGIIVGSGSASFEIIRDLVEKLPLMVAPRWIETPCQPIAVRNVIQFLKGVPGRQDCFNCDFDIAGPDVLSYRQMLLQFAEVRRLRRYILTVPVMTPRLSSYWLYFVTSTSYPLAVNLVDSMKTPVVARPNNLARELGIELISYRKAIELAFAKIEEDNVPSSWKDAFISSDTPIHFMQQGQVPTHGCFRDIKWRTVDNDKVDTVVERIWRIGGRHGWYYGNWMWRIRGLLDKLVGGVGLRRGRRSPTELWPGDALDFWRVLIADKERRRLLLYAEMKLPGEAWLEFRIMQKDHRLQLRQTATFRPRGLAGRLYWYSVLPFHGFIFNGMIRELTRDVKPDSVRSHEAGRQLT